MIIVYFRVLCPQLIYRVMMGVENKSKLFPSYAAFMVQGSFVAMGARGGAGGVVGKKLHKLNFTRISHGKICVESW